MSDEIIEPLHASHGSAPVNRFEPHLAQPHHHAGQVISGRIVAVSQGRQHPGEHHQFDVTVGGSEFTEIVLRVPNGVYGHIEGHTATLHVDPE